MKHRKYVNLKPPSGFTEIPRAVRVSDLRREHYTTGDRAEYCIGLFSEDATPTSRLPPLIQRMVAVDACSQAPTNPLLSRHVFLPATFSGAGWEAIQEMRSPRDVVDRNTRPGASFIGMTRPGRSDT